ncbi:hypothetical protein R6Q57_006754 [Mikania cordata]
MNIQLLHVAFKIIQLTIFTIFTNIASLLRAALNHIGVLRSPPDSDSHPASSGSHVIILSGSSSFLLRVPVPIMTANIKHKVPIIPYLCSSHRCDNAVCMVCLDCINGDHLIRELVNCEHVFHRECLDAWVDVGHVHCPLCRSMLLSKKLAPLAL